MNDTQHHLTTIEASTLLKCRETTVRSYSADGHLRAVKLGRRWLVQRSSVEELLRRGSQP